MACKINPERSSNALKNLSDMFVVKGQKSLLDFIEEADKYLDSMHENQFNHLIEDIGRFIKHVSKKKSKRSRPSRRRTAGGSWQDPSQGPYTPPVNPLHEGQIVAPVRMAPVPLDQGQPVQMVQPMVQGPPIQMVQGPPVHMPRGPQGPGVVRGLIRVGATFLLPRTTTGVVYAGLWLAVAIMAGLESESQKDFFKAGIEQITSGDCMGVRGRFSGLRHPLCTRYQTLMIPMLDALNQLMNFDPRGFGVLAAGLGMIVTGPLLIDAVIYELAFTTDYVITTALQSFSGRPLIPPTRSTTRPNIPHLMGRMLSLTNPGAMSALSVGQVPIMGQPVGNQYFVPVPGQPYAQAYPLPYAQAYPQPMMQQPMMQPMQQQPMMPQQAAALWDPQMAPPQMAPPAPRPPRGRRVDRVFNAEQAQRNANAASDEEARAYEAYARARERSASLRRRQAEVRPRAPNRGGPGNGGPANRRSSNRNRGGPGNGSGNGTRRSSRRSSGR